MKDEYEMKCKQCASGKKRKDLTSKSEEECEACGGTGKVVFEKEGKLKQPKGKKLKKPDSIALAGILDGAKIKWGIGRVADKSVPFTFIVEDKIVITFNDLDDLVSMGILDK